MIVHAPPARTTARLSPRSRKIWLTAHVATSVGWLGSAYTMLVLSLTVAFGAYLLSVPRVLSMIAALPAGTDTGATAAEIVALSVGSITILTAVTAISVFKPWGRIQAMAQGQAAYDAAATTLGLRPLNERLLRVMESARTLQMVACLALAPQPPILVDGLRPTLDQWRAAPPAGKP